MSENYQTSRSYEKLIDALIRQEFTGIDGVDLIEIVHNARLKGLSGYSHQIDVAYRFRIWQIELMVLVECKQYRRKVGVDDLLEFRSRLDDLRAHKGVFVTSTGFQEGAIQFAEANRIALLIARGSQLRHVRYCLESPSPAERCERQLRSLRDAYRTSGTPLDKRLKINRGYKFVSVSHNGASVVLTPFELHQSLLYRRVCDLEENSMELFFEGTRISNIRIDRVLKVLILDELLGSTPEDNTAGRI